MPDEKSTCIHPVKIATIVTGVISILLAFGAFGAAETKQPYPIQMGLGLGALGGSLLTTVGGITSAFIPDKVNKPWMDIAQRYWQLAGVAEKIDLKLKPALDTLAELIHQDAANSFDFIFIDADKQNYKNYYEFSLQLLRPGGLVVIDNVLWSGKVADPTAEDASTISIREFNSYLLQDSRISLSLLPLGDGLTLARKR